MDPVLGDLVLRHLLEEQPRTTALGVLDGRPGVALLLRHTDPREEVVPRSQRIGVLGEVDPGRPGVDVAQDVGVESDLEVAAHGYSASGVFGG